MVLSGLAIRLHGSAENPPPALHGKALVRYRLVGQRQRQQITPSPTGEAERSGMEEGLEERRSTEAKE